MWEYVSYGIGTASQWVVGTAAECAKMTYSVANYGTQLATGALNATYQAFTNKTLQTVLKHYAYAYIVNGTAQAVLSYARDGAWQLASEQDPYSSYGIPVMTVTLVGAGILTAGATYYKINGLVQKNVVNAHAPGKLSSHEKALTQCRSNQLLDQLLRDNGVSEEDIEQLQAKEGKLCSQDSFKDRVDATVAYPIVQTMLDGLEWGTNDYWLVHLLSLIHQAQFIQTMGSSGCSKHEKELTDSGLTVALAIALHYLKQVSLSVLPEVMGTYLSPLVTNLIVTGMMLSWTYAPQQKSFYTPKLSMDPTTYFNNVTEFMIRLLEPGIEKKIKAALKDKRKPTIDLMALGKKIQCAFNLPGVKFTAKWLVPPYVLDWKQVKNDPVLRGYAKDFVESYGEFIHLVETYKRHNIAKPIIAIAQQSKLTKKGTALALKHSLNIPKPVTIIALLILRKPELEQIFKDLYFKLLGEFKMDPQTVEREKGALALVTENSSNKNKEPVSQRFLREPSLFQAASSSANQLTLNNATDFFAEQARRQSKEREKNSSDFTSADEKDESDNEALDGLDFFARQREIQRKEKLTKTSQNGSDNKIQQTF